MFAALTVIAALGAEPSPKQIELLKTFRSEFIEITPGKGKYPKSFVMGRAKGSAAEQPARKVTFDYKFHVAKYEVPQNLYEALIGKNPSRWKGPRNSAEMFDHKEAIEFCRKATAMLRAAKLITAPQVIRLPSEAEWEYTARAGTTSLYSFGDDAAKHVDYAWSTENAKGNDPPVGAKRPNAWGLYDVHGYLWEMCADRWHDDYKGAPSDGSVWTKDGDKHHYVVRGGSWKDKAAKLTSSYRLKSKNTTRDAALGFRCVLAAADDK